MNFNTIRVAGDVRQPIIQNVHFKWLALALLVLAGALIVSVVLFCCLPRRQARPEEILRKLPQKPAYFVSRDQILHNLNCKIDFSAQNGFFTDRSGHYRNCSSCGGATHRAKTH